MDRAHRIALPAFPGAQSLDVTEPDEVFLTASRLQRQRSGEGAVYQVEVLASEAGLLRSFLRHLETTPNDYRRRFGR